MMEQCRFNQKKYEALQNKAQDGTLFVWSLEFYELQFQKRQRYAFIQSLYTNGASP